MKKEIIIENGVELTRETFYNESGKINSEWYSSSGEFHRENEPAVICYYENGNIKNEYYYLNDKYHRENGAAIIYYDENGNIEEEYYFLNDIEIKDDLRIMVMRGLNLI